MSVYCSVCITICWVYCVVCMALGVVYSGCVCVYSRWLQDGGQFARGEGYGGQAGGGFIEVVKQERQYRGEEGGDGRFFSLPSLHSCFSIFLHHSSFPLLPSHSSPPFVLSGLSTFPSPLLFFLLLLLSSQIMFSVLSSPFSITPVLSLY